MNTNLHLMKRTLLSIFMLLIGFEAFSQNQNTPYNVVMNIHEDPSTTMAFNWFTGKGTIGGDVKITLGSDTITVPATYIQRSNYTENKAVVTGLIPNTTYSFQVGGVNNIWSNTGTFTTAKINKDPFSFVYVTDSQEWDADDYQIHQINIHEAFTNYPNAKFWLHCGDIVYRGELQVQWDKFIAAHQDHFYHYPFAPVVGNHDIQGTNNTNFSRYFNMENFGSSDPHRSTYTFIYGDAQFFAINGERYDADLNTYISDLTTWMNTQINHNYKWHIVYFHKSAYTGTDLQRTGTTEKQWRLNITPIFDALNIDLVLFGHDHLYQVIGPVFNKEFVEGSVSNVQTVPFNNPKNVSEKKGGIFNVKEGTLYFCNNSVCYNEPKFSPLLLTSMKHTLSNDIPKYSSLFTGMLGQNGNPTYSNVSVSTDAIVITTYEINNGNSQFLDEIKIVKYCEPYTQGMVEYTNNQTFTNTTLIIGEELRIKNNATVTFRNSTVRFHENAKVIIESGSKLVLDGTTLTNSCPDKMWQGVTVMGDPNKPMTLVNQGYVEMKGHSKIENALCGITVNGGGMVDAYQFMFKNNTLGVYFKPVASGQTGISGKFIETDFDLTDYFLDDYTNFAGHLKMESSGEVQLKLCRFTNTSSENINYGVVADNTSTTWTNVNEFHSVPVVVQSGATLTNTGVIRNDKNAKITVQPGGKIIIDGGTLTNACPDIMWQGVTVNGIAQNQGSVSVINGGTIENATNAITVNKFGSVYAKDAFFVNNKRSVYLKQNAAGGTFKRTKFEVNDDFIGDCKPGSYGDKRDFDAHIIAFKSGKVSVEGCAFSSTVKKTGIRASDSDLEIKEYCPQGCSFYTYCQGCPIICSEKCMIRSTFSGFQNAIYAGHSGILPSFKVRYSLFEDNGFESIRISGLNYPELLKNDFFISSMYSSGITITNSTGYKVEENFFMDSLPSQSKITYGTVINNSGSPENEIYKNTYVGLNIAQQFLGKNSSRNDMLCAGCSRGIDDPLTPQEELYIQTGLQTLCNTFQKTAQIDILLGISSSINNMNSIKNKQGSLQNPAGNLFFDKPVYNLDNLRSQQNLYYYYDLNAPNSLPNKVSNNVTLTFTTTSNGCPSKAFTMGGGIPTKDGEEWNIDKALAQYDEWNAQYEYWLARAKEVCGVDEMMRRLDDEMIKGETGNEECLMILDRVLHYSALKDNYFNAIIVAAFEDEMMRGLDDEVINQSKSAQSESSEFYKFENLRFLFSYRGQYGDYLSITETYLAENNHRMALATLNNMHTLFELSEYGKRELQGLQTYIHWRQKLHDAEENIYELNEAEIDFLMNFVERNVGRGVVFANNILCILYNICLEEKGEGKKEKGELLNNTLNPDSPKAPLVAENLRKSVSSASSACPKNLANIKIYPNPTTGELIIDNGQLTINSVEVFDIYGRKLSSHHLIPTSSHPKIDISHLNVGEYFIKITTDSGKITKKIIKQ